MRPWVTALVVGPFVACGSTARPVDGPLRFDKTVIDAAYRAEGVAVVDVDRDGHLDIVTDQFWYAGPALTPHPIRAPAPTYDPATALCDGFAVYPQDIDGDGWPDILVTPHPGDPMYWYENPHGASLPWARHPVVPAGVAGLETPIVADLFADGRSLLVMTDSVRGVLAWFEPPADPTQLWTSHPISGPAFAGGPVFTHGIGVGDMNGDGRLDVLTGFGWFEQTSDRTTWTVRTFAFGPNPNACSRMFAYDVDGDGRTDVLCARPHDYGLHWFQRLPDHDADPAFADHVIDSTISQMHALRLDDLDRDGTPEIVSGKRWWARGAGLDPGPNDPSLLVYYQLRRGAGGVSFVRHEIDGDSGVGVEFAIADVDGDGKLDVVVSNKKGLAFFRQQQD